MQGYLRDLDAQVREKKEREEREAEEELRKDRSLIRRNNGGDWRGGLGHRGGGGGEPLRDEAGRMCAGVRGLFNRELNSDVPEPAVAVQHADPHGAAGQGIGHRPGSASSVGSSHSAGRNVRTTGRRGCVIRRDPNAGHKIFGSDAPGVCVLPPSSRGSLVAAHEVAGTDGPVQSYRVPGDDARNHRATPDQQQHRGARRGSDSQQQQQQQQWRWRRQQQEEELDCISRGGRGSEESVPVPPESSTDRVEVSAKWLETLLLERDLRRQEGDQLRRQLCEAGLTPRC
jgi:hypothetical protein